MTLPPTNLLVCPECSHEAKIILRKCEGLRQLGIDVPKEFEGSKLGDALASVEGRVWKNEAAIAWVCTNRDCIEYLPPIT